MSRPRTVLVLPLSLWLMPVTGKCRQIGCVGLIANNCRFADKVIRAAKGEKGLVEPSFVYLPGVQGGDAVAKATGTEFFSVPIELGPSGAEKAIDVVSSANDHEKKLLQACYDGLKGNISKGVEFAQNPPAK